MMQYYNHPRPYLAVDCVAMCFVRSSKQEPIGGLRILLKWREDERKFALPGKFLISSERKKRGSSEVEDEYGDQAETIAQTFRRALEMTRRLDGTIATNETLYLSKYYKKHGPEGKRSPSEFQDDEFIIQLPIRDAVRRDEDRVVPEKDPNGNIIKDKDGEIKMVHPNYRVLSIPILTLMLPKPEEIRAPNANDQTQWIPLSWIIQDNPEIQDLYKIGGIKDLPRDPHLPLKFRLAFDHSSILASAILKLREIHAAIPLGRELLPKLFKLSDLICIYNNILGYEIAPTNFKKTTMERKPRKAKDTGMTENSNLIVPTDMIDTNTARRPSRLVQFDDTVYNYYKQHQNFNFTL